MDLSRKDKNMNLKIKDGQKYKVLIQCHYFPDDNEDDERGFVMFPGEVYNVKYIMDWQI